MAVMARSLGIPARIATGYTQGTFDETRGVYQVYQFNAHTWTEIYFPQYGWVQFEPTASQPALVRLQPSSANDANTGLGAADRNLNGPNRAPEDVAIDPSHKPITGLNPPQTASGATEISPWWLIIGGVLVLGLLVVAAMYVYEMRGSGSRVQRGGEWAFARMARMARWLRVKLSPWQTPFEQAHALSQIMPHNEATIERVASLYVHERYGRGEPEPLEAQLTWRSLRGPMWWMGFKRRLPRSLPSLRKIFRRTKPVGR
jgi:hypothetical protein